MKAIEPVSVWFNGVEQQANRLNLYLINDNLKDTAQFFYALYVEEEVPTTTTTTSEDPGPAPVPSPTMIIQVAQGNLSMTGQEYIDWNEGPEINDEAYVWGASKLNLTLI